MKRQSLEFGRQLASVPMRNERVKQCPGEPGQTPVLEVELQYSGLMAPLGWLLPLRRRRRIQLDPIGWGVYARLDGRKTFEQLVDEFALEHKLEFLESRALLMAHIRNLMRSGLVVVGIKNNKETPA